jgi:polyisoprenoid-binding protein YceI
MKTRVWLAVAVIALAAPSVAQQPPMPPSTDPARLESGDYALDPAHARILFSYKHFGYSTSYGMFTLPSARLHFDAATPAKCALDATIDLNGIDTTVDKLDNHLKSADFFDIAKFPAASFHSTAVTMTGPTSATVTGELTVHGITKPVTLTVVLNGGAPHPMAKVFTLGFDATGVIKRSDFGIGAYVPLVGDEVTLTISAEFRKVG